MKEKFRQFAMGLFDLGRFDGDLNTNVTTANTTGNDLSVEMKTYYSDYLIDRAGAGA